VRPPENVDDLTGRRFGRLVVIDYDGMNSRHITLWRCKCDCSREKVVQRGALLNGTTWRCGRNCPFDTGMFPGATFGALMLLRIVRESTTQTDETWLCRCECGNEVEVTTRKLRRHVVTSCGCRSNARSMTRDKRGNVNDTTLDELTDAPKSNNTTGVRGVSFYGTIGKYHVTITFRRNVYHLGNYAQLEDAKSVRKEAERLIWGPAIESNGERYPDHGECLEIVRGIRDRYAKAEIRRLAEQY
jgi:hypothetical protein